MAKQTSKPTKNAPKRPETTPSAPKAPTKTPWYIAAAAVAALSGVLFSSMLGNGFTNWDDEYYIVQNALLRGPDWAGIFQKPVVSNYHPLTIATLAWNYQISELKPFSYHLVNWALHLFNAFLVFYFAWRLSDRKIWVAGIASVLFAVHPMHVESVAWVSERKDVLYTFFFLLSLIGWQNFLQKEQTKYYWAALGCFLLSLLSKPAAVVLPLVLLLLDYWYDKPLDRKRLLEKIPFFALSLLFAYMALQIQSVKAIADYEKYTIFQRLLFGCYGLMVYLIKFFVPYQMSAFHPFPRGSELGWPYYAAPLGVLAMGVLLYRARRNKIVVWGALFYVVNLLLVLQVLSFGNAVIAERYTYAPYIGLSFALAMLWDQSRISPGLKQALLGLMGVWAVALSFATIQRIGVWRNSETLWTDVLTKYPGTEVAAGNRAHHYMLNGRMDEALADCTAGLQTRPTHKGCLDARATIYLHKKNPTAALADASTLARYYPSDARGYLLMGFAYKSLDSTALAIKNLEEALRINPSSDDAHGTLGTVLFNNKKEYQAALEHFNQAIALDPNDGLYFLNRSRCYYMLGDKPKALADAQKAEQMKQAGAAAFIKTIQAPPQPSPSGMEQ